jgi:hypothetical protein
MNWTLRVRNGIAISKEYGMKRYYDRTFMEHEKILEDHWQSVPMLKFKPSWEVRVMPSLWGALVRFQVSKRGKLVSVYLDVENNMGCYDGHYWEAYNFEDDPERFSKSDTEGLMDYISKSLK